MEQLDTCGLSCPQPVLLLKEALKSKDGGSITVLSDSDASRENLIRLARSLGWSGQVSEESPGVYKLIFSK